MSQLFNTMRLYSKTKKVEHISKIVPLKALRTDYSMHSSKRSLSKAYELFLGDECVMGLLPGILGKIFYAKKKTVPVSVNLGLKDLKKEIDRTVNNTRCELNGAGSSSMFCIGNNKMGKNQLANNLLAACKQLAEKVPGGQANVRNMHIKTTDTPAIPVYMNLESPNDIKLPKVQNEPLQTFVDEITTLEEGKVMIRSDGMIKVIGGEKKNDVENMSDDDDEEEESDDEDSDEDNDGNKDVPKPTKEKDDDSSDEDEEEEEIKVVQKPKQKPLKDISKGPNQVKNNKKRGIEDKEDKTVAKKKQKQSDIKQKPAATKKQQQNQQPSSNKKQASAKKTEPGKKSPPAAKQPNSSKKPVTDKEPVSTGGKNKKRRPKNA